MSETGVIKFRCEHAGGALAPFPGMTELDECRSKLLQLGWVGVDANGIGFGNLSVRVPASDEFYITGSGTSAIIDLLPEHFAKVTAYDFDRNWLRCEGATVASSESLTHAAVYEARKNIGAVIHCHSAAIWTGLRDLVPTTAAQVEYGTPEMAKEVRRLFHETDVMRQKIFLMAGHAEGVVAFGSDIAEALSVLTGRAEVALCLSFRNTES